MRSSALGRVIAVCIGALALAVGGPAIAAASHGGKGHSHSAKKHKKKPKVKCAANSITCQTHLGPAGTPGANGTPGGPGSNSGSIVTRIRGGTQTTTLCTADANGNCPSSAANYALTGGSWTQGASESDLLGGQMTVTFPPTGSGAGKCNTGGPLQMVFIEVYLDGQQVLSSHPDNMFSGEHTNTYPSIPVSLSGGTVTDDIDITHAAAIAATGSSAPHTLTASVWDNCTNPNPGEVHPQVTSFALDVIGLS